MTTHNNQEDETLTPEASHSTPISNSAPEASPEAPVNTAEDSISSAPSSLSPEQVSAPVQAPVQVKVKPFISEKEPRAKNPTLGLALFTSGISLGALGCGLVIARGPFAGLVDYLQPLAERGLTGGSMVLTGMVLTAMAIVERQLRKQTQALETQEGNATMLQDIFGAMATIDARFDEVQTSELQVYAETNLMRNELHQFIAAQDGKDEQTGIFHVAASVDKLSAQVDRTLKRFGSDIETKLHSAHKEAQEKALATSERLESKMQELEPQELPDNSELIAAQADTVKRLQAMESSLRETRSELGQVGESVQSNVNELLTTKLQELEPEEAYDDSAVLAGQLEIADRLAALEENLRNTQEHVDLVGDCVQTAVQGLKPQDPYDDTSVLVGQAELADRLSTIEENCQNTEKQLSQIGDTVQKSVQESLQDMPPQESQDEVAMLAGQSAIVDRLQAMETHLEKSEERIGEVRESLVCSVNSTVQEAVKSALNKTLNKKLEDAPAIQPVISESTQQDKQALQAFLSSEPMETPSVQTWPLESPKQNSTGHRVQENPPLEILHMPSEEELISAVDVEQDQMAHALDHLFQPIQPGPEDKQEALEELYLDNIPQRMDTPPAQESTPPNGSQDAMPYITSGPSPIPGTPGSPFPAPVPLRPTDSDDVIEPPSEGTSEFQKPYEPPSDDTGFRFPGWN